MAYTYSTFQTALALSMATPNGVLDAQTASFLPSIIDYAEQRIYRDLDLLSTTVRQTAALTAGSRALSIATAFEAAPFIVVQDANIITPSTVTSADSGARNPCLAVSRQWLDAVWNSSANAAPPQFFCNLDGSTLLFGPWPDQGYSVEVIGTVRPAPLYSLGSGGSTFLTTFLPDLFLAAAMISASGFQKNFGAQSDNPQQALSWEATYQALHASANVEEMRKKFAVAPAGKAA